MKKKLLAVALMCSIYTSGSAQIYSYDSWTQLPTRDMYDPGLMNMYLNAIAQTQARRQHFYDYYGNLTVDAYKEGRWYDAIQYATKTLEIDPESDFLYYIRGYAYEQIGNEKAAKRDYKKGKKYGDRESARALDRLNNKGQQDQDNRYFSK